jgi:hypothetical protein
MAIDPTTTTTVRVSELASAGYNTTDLIPHEVAGILKKGNLQDLATFIGSIIDVEGSVGFRAVNVTDGQTLPATTEEEFILVGPGTFPNVGGGSAITTTEPLNALVSNGTYWFIGVEIPIAASGAWGSIEGNIETQTDLQDALDLKADLVDGKVPASQLPSYVDDVVEVANYAALPSTGETGKIYITIDTNKVYRWSGSAYIEIAADKATWGLIDGTLSNQTDLQNALNAKFNNPTGNTTQYIAGDGSLISFPIAGQAGTIVREIRNTTGSTLAKGTIVYISGASGNKPTVSKALATGDSTSAQTFGMVQASISNNSNGYVVCMGDLTGLDTSAISEGAQLYLSSTTAGAYTTTKQTAPAHLVYIGVVTRSHATQGQIEVKIQNGYELDEIHDVAISSVANNQVLVYESATSLWKNKSISTVLGYTPQAQLSGTGFVKASGTTISYDNTTYLSGTVAIANGGTGATTAGAARTNLGATTVGANIFTIPNPNPVTKAYIRANADNTVEWLDGNAFRESIGAGTGNGTVTSVNGTGSYGGLTLTGTVTSSGDLTLGGTPTGTWPISVSGNAASVNTVFNTTNADHYITFADANNGSPTAEFLYTVGTLKYNPNTGALTAGSFVKSGGTSSQFLMADGSVSTGSGGTVTSVAAITLGTTGTDLSSTVANGTTTPVITLNVPTASATNRGALSSADWTTFNSKQNALTNPVTGTGTTNYIPKFTGSSAIGNSSIFDNGQVNIGSTSFAGDELLMVSMNGTTNTQAINVKDRNASANASTFMVFRKSDDTFLGNIRRSGTSDALYIGGNSFLALGVGGNTEAMRIASSGNVGIGTTTPSYKFDLNSNAGGISFKTYTSTTNNTEHTYSKDAGFFIDSYQSVGGAPYTKTTDLIANADAGADSQLRLFTATTGGNPAERMRITSGGNVGIGTTSPIQKLHVEGSSYFLTDIFTGNNGGIFFSGNSTFTSGVFQNSSGLNLQTGGSPRLTITSGGNVLIGTTTDAGYNLQVAGNAIIGTSSTTSQFRFYRATNVAGLEIQGGSGSASVGGSAYLRLGDVTNSRYWLQQINNSYNLAYWFFDGGSWSQPITFTNNGSASFAGSVTATSGFFNSDNRLKDLIDYDYNVSDIKPITYLWKDGRDNKKHIGYSAQEVQKVMPDAVNEDEKGFLSVNYVEVLVAQVELLNNRMAEMQKEIELLKSK